MVDLSARMRRVHGSPEDEIGAVSMHARSVLDARILWYSTPDSARVSNRSLTAHAEHHP